jgi:lactoylglutathione lyase
MKLDHIALYVEDLEKMKDFYTCFFDAVPNQRYHNPKTGLQTYFLSFSDGSRLEIMQRPDARSRLSPAQRTTYNR